MRISSPNFVDQGLVSSRHTSDGGNISPGLWIKDVPRMAQSLVVVMESLGARGKSTSTRLPKNQSSLATQLSDQGKAMDTAGRVHWLMWNILPDIEFIPEGTPPTGAVVGINDYWEHGYGGPYPPPGETHEYSFKVFALDIALDLPSSATKPELLAAIKGHIIDQDEMICWYKRNN